MFLFVFCIVLSAAGLASIGTAIVVGPSQYGRGYRDGERLERSRRPITYGYTVVEGDR